MVFDTAEENRFSCWQSTNLRKDNADKTTKVLQATNEGGWRTFVGLPDLIKPIKYGTHSFFNKIKT